MTNALSLRPGDRVPDFALPGLDGKLRKFIWSFTGEPVALLAVDDLANSRRRAVRGLRWPLQGCRRRRRRRRRQRASRPRPRPGPSSAARRGPLLLCDGERKFVPALLAQGGVALRLRRRPAPCA